jgi:hypothetical protein
MDALLGVVTGATAASVSTAPFVFPSVGSVCISSVTSTASGYVALKSATLSLEDRI